MKKLGYLLIAIGFLAGSLIAVVDKTIVNWIHFIPALAIGIAGVIVVKIHDYKHSRSEEKLTGHLSDIENSLANILKNINNFCTENETLDPYKVHNRIDELFAEDMNTFIDARTAIGHIYGLQEYADMMSYFASGERALNRAWSASTDGYVDEIKDCLTKAKANFNTVLEKIDKLKLNESLTDPAV